MSLADAYLPAIRSMDGAKPRPLEPFAVFTAQQSEDSSDVSLGALRDHLAGARVDDVLRKELHLAIAGWDAKTEGDWLGDTAPNSEARRTLVYGLLGLDEATSATLDEAFPRTGDGSVVISDEFLPWYTAERRSAHEFYWRAYRKHLLDGGWDPNALLKLDTATTRVVERLSDPTRAQAFQAKGLVVGYVQSGKTANFTGVIAKAIDAGYRLVIVLTGTVDILRKQTQRRLDMELVGIENIFLGVDPADPEIAKDFDYFTDDDRLNDKFLKHGFQPSEQGFTDIVRLTRHGSDYRSLNAGITALEVHKLRKQKPLYDPENLFASDARLAVVKKNASVLKRLVKDLKSIRSHLGEIPTLIIDDESDQASVNTSNPKKWTQGQTERTSINKLISELLTLLPRAQYVGYTATPYANVFIDPSDVEDIFPKDFLISLERPPGYMGVRDFHDLDASFDDDETVENSNEKAFVRGLYSNIGSAEAEADLRNALDAFLLAGAMKLFRENITHGKPRFRHHTMLVHETVKQTEHKDLADLVKDIWGKAGYMSGTAMPRLAELLENDFRPVWASRASELPFPSGFDELKPYIGRALTKIQEHAGNPVLVVNGDKDIQQPELDFEGGSVWRVLVGGTKLSRGFTIEGLTTTYYRRRTKQADSLMQMGRWFGFRAGYQDLVRLFIGRDEPDGRSTIDLYGAFEAIVRDEEAFRGQLEKYAKLVDGQPQITPRDIPPLVSQHLPAIKPAAPNKMFNAELVVRRSAGEPVEPTAYPTDPVKIKANFTTFLPIAKSATTRMTLSWPTEVLDSGATRTGGTFSSYVGTVGASELQKAIAGLKWLSEEYFVPDLAYIKEITGTSVKDWVVVLPQTKESVALHGVGDRSVFQRVRRRDPFFGALSDPKHRPVAQRACDVRASWGDAQVDALAKAERGSILIYPVVEPGRSADQIIFAFTLFTPRSTLPANGQVIQFRAKDSGAPRAAIVNSARSPG